MHYTLALFLICLVTSFIEVTHSQSIHVVKIGDSGSFYDPQVTIARTGDTVFFQWTASFHSVTQSSFDNPCTPLPGGFDSGVTGNANQQFLIPSWNLTITDDTQPIWFFCKVVTQASHCTSGMVGAINVDLVNGNQSFNNFSQNAKLITNPPTASRGQPAVLTGIGAFATSTPIPLHNATNVTSTIPPSTSTSSSSSTATTSSTPPPVQTQQNSTTSGGLSAGVKGGIAGGAVGALLLVILLVLLFMSYRRARRYRKEAKSIRELRSKSSRDMSHIDRLDLLYNGSDQPPLTPSQQVVHLHRSQGAPSVTESLERDSTSPSVNIKELAAEIARNMRQDINIHERDRSGMLQQPQDLASLSTVPEQLLADAVSRSGSSRGAESARGRQLPRPPQSRADVRSVDTLPAYAPGHSK